MRTAVRTEQLHLVLRTARSSIVRQGGLLTVLCGRLAHDLNAFHAPGRNVKCVHQLKMCSGRDRNEYSGRDRNERCGHDRAGRLPERL